MLMDTAPVTLAIECATEACSVALFGGDTLLDARHETIGRGHAERLIPLISELPGKGRADAIRVSLGPGSFTGIRIGLAAARALGVAWQAEVTGYPTLGLVACVARSQAQSAEQAAGASQVTVCMTGGHGEWFVQDFGSDGRPETALVSLTPDAAAARGAHEWIAGSQADALAGLLGPGHTPLTVLPDARHALALPGALLTKNLSALYGRAPDAKPAHPSS